MSVSGIISVFKSILSFLIAPIKKKLLDQPKVYFDFELRSSSYFRDNDDDPLPSFEKRFDYNLVWNYTMHLRNNSEHHAYNIKLLFPVLDQNFKLKENLNSLEPVMSNRKLTLQAIFTNKLKATGKMANQESNGFPPYLKEKKFLLEYTNVRNTKFYTIYDHTAPEGLKNKFQRRK